MLLAHNLIRLAALFLYFPIRILRELMAPKIDSITGDIDYFPKTIFITHSDGNEELKGQDSYYLKPILDGDYFIKIHRKKNKIEEAKNCACLFLRSRNNILLFEYWIFYFRRFRTDKNFTVFIKSLLLDKYSHFKLASLLIAKVDSLIKNQNISKETKIIMTCEGHLWELLFAEFLQKRRFSDVNLYSHSAITADRARDIYRVFTNVPGKLFVSYTFQKQFFVEHFGTVIEKRIQKWGRTKSRLKKDIERLRVDGSGKTRLVLIEGLYTEIIGTILYLLIFGGSTSKGYYLKLHPRVSDSWLNLFTFICPGRVAMGKSMPPTISNLVVCRGTFANFELAEAYPQVRFFYPEVPWLSDRDIFLSQSPSEAKIFERMTGRFYGGQIVE